MADPVAAALASFLRPEADSLEPIRRLVAALRLQGRRDADTALFGALWGRPRIFFLSPHPSADHAG